MPPETPPPGPEEPPAPPPWPPPAGRAGRGDDPEEPSAEPPESPPALASPRGIVFDLDGTLIDSRRDITTAINGMRAERGLPPLSVAEVRTMESMREKRVSFRIGDTSIGVACRNTF